MVNRDPDLLREPKIPISITFTLLAGLGFISLVLVLIVLLITVFSNSGLFIGYPLIILAGLAIGYYTLYIKKKIDTSEKLGVIFGIFSHILPLLLIISSLTVLQNLAKQITTFAGQAGGVGMLELFDVGVPNPILFGILFYLLANVFIVGSVIKKKEYSVFIWYLLAPALFFMLWLITNLFVSTIMMT